jgi:hypothetical protein
VLFGCRHVPGLPLEVVALLTSQLLGGCRLPVTASGVQQLVDEQVFAASVRTLLLLQETRERQNDDNECDELAGGNPGCAAHTTW